MSAPAPATVQHVHVEIPGFQALSERGHWDACAVVAEIDALHVCGWNAVALAENSINAWRWQYVQAKRWTEGHGTTLSNIYWHLTQTPIRAHVAGYIPYSDAPNVGKLHDFLKFHASRGNPVIIEVSRAYNLPKNERGVEYHFVTIGGIDSDLGYLVANGDTVDAFAHPAGATLPLNWATWAQLVSAGICGAIALQRELPTPPPPPAPPPPPVVPMGLSAAIAQAEALLAALKAMETPGAGGGH